MYVLGHLRVKVPFLCISKLLSQPQSSYQLHSMLVVEIWKDKTLKRLILESV